MRQHETCFAMHCILQFVYFAFCAYFSQTILHTNETCDFVRALWEASLKKARTLFGHRPFGGGGRVQLLLGQCPNRTCAFFNGASLIAQRIYFPINRMIQNLFPLWSHLLALQFLGCLGSQNKFCWHQLA